MSKTTLLTLEAMKADGWVVSDGKDPSCLAEKMIENLNPLNASEDSEIKLILHRMYNCEMFAILLPDGGMLNFIANTMDELKAFEKAVNFYDPPF